MMGRVPAICFAAGLAVLAGHAHAPLESPQEVEICALQAQPAAYDHKLIDISGTVSHGFEDFQLSDRTCGKPFGLWLEFGGKATSGTIYCCSGSRDRTRRPSDLVVEGLTVPLVENALFKAFDARIIQSPRQTSFHAKLRGRFFSGKLQQSPGGPEWWGGYGHMGCCSLLVIQQVLALN